MLRRGIQTAGVLRLCSSTAAVVSLPLIDSSLIFHSICLSILAHVGRTADSFSPLLRSICLCGELRSHRYFQDAVWRHWLHCPHLTSSCTLWLCRIVFQTTRPQFIILPQHAMLPKILTLDINYECASSYCYNPEISFQLQGDSNGLQQRINKIRGPWKTRVCYDLLRLGFYCMFKPQFFLLL